MEFHVFKIFETINNYFYYIISHIDNEDLNLDIAESWAAEDVTNTINMYLTMIGFNNVSIEKSSISPLIVLQKSFQHDIKNMNISDDYKKILEEGLTKIKEKKTKVKKVKEVTELKPKKEPKIKAKKSTLSNKVIIEQSPKEVVSFD